MKQSMQLGLGQNLAMTMQLQQAIALLQMHSLELYQEIQQKLESNPFLEVDEGYASRVANLTDSRVKDELSTAPDADNPFEHSANATFERLDFDGETPATEVLPAASGSIDYGGWDGVGGGDREVWETTAGIPSQSLQEYLHWQLDLMNLSADDAIIAAFLIDSINDDGFLQEPLENVFAYIQTQRQQEGVSVELDEVAAVLHRIQQLDPVGVGAVDLRECLLVQLGNLARELTQDDDTRQELQLAERLVAKHLDGVASADLSALARAVAAPLPAVESAVALIKSLNPKPGSGFSRATTEYIVPDVVVRKDNGVWRAQLNPDLLPKLNINAYYMGLVKRGDKSADGQFMRDHLQEARFFIKSLQSRNDTILKVTEAILQKQRLFFEYGEEAMQPLVLKDVAEMIEMHESTISRVTTQKYMHTPRGVYELKFFFSSSVKTSDGGECSAVAIQALIKKLVAAERADKPLSDNKITALLAEHGIAVARRTVAKYREALKIPPSNERRR